MTTRIPANPPPGVKLPGTPAAGSVSIAELEGPTIDQAVIPTKELVAIVAGQGLLGQIDPIEHPLFREWKIQDPPLFGKPSRLLLPALLVLAGGAVAFSLPGAVGGTVFILSEIAGLLLMVRRVRSSNDELIPKRYEEMLTGGLNQNQWKHLLQKIAKGRGVAEVNQALQDSGITWRQLVKEVRPIKKDGKPLTGKDVRKLFTDLIDEDAGDYVGLAYATRALGPLALSTTNMAGASDYFAALTEDMTGRQRGASPVEVPNEMTPAFYDLIGDMAYTIGSTSIPPFVLMGAHLMKYHVGAGRGDDVARMMLSSIQGYLWGDFNEAYRSHAATLNMLEQNDESIEAVGVAALQHLAMAQLVHERVAGMDEPYEMLITQGRVHAEAAVAGLAALVHEVPSMSAVDDLNIMSGHAQDLLK